VLESIAPIEAGHSQSSGLVALAGRAYQAWASGERETTTALVWVPILTGLKPSEPARQGRWEPAGSNDIDAKAETWRGAAESVDPEGLRALADRLLLTEGSMVSMVSMATVVRCCSMRSLRR
jgi:hypothetical protein